MADRLDNIFNVYSLTIINVVIVVLALMTNGGLFFIETGLIHLIALLFIALAVLRILYHHYTYDPILEKFVRASSFALFVFAGSHIIEYASMMFFNQYKDSVFANVANFYLIGTFSIIAGATYFTSINYQRYSSFLRKLSYACILGLFIFSVYLFTNDKAISLELDEVWPYLYAGMLFIAGILASIEIKKIRHLTPIMIGFTRYLQAALIVILIAILPNIFYDALEMIGIKTVTSVYISHFMFYAALSLFFLSFKQLSHLGGVYDDLKALNEHGPRPNS